MSIWKQCYNCEEYLEIDISRGDVEGDLVHWLTIDDLLHLLKGKVNTNSTYEMEKFVDSLQCVIDPRIKLED